MSAAPLIVLVLVIVLIELWPLPVKAVIPEELTRTKATTSSFAATEINDQHGHDLGPRRADW